MSFLSVSSSSLTRQKNVSITLTNGLLIILLLLKKLIFTIGYDALSGFMLA